MKASKEALNKIKLDAMADDFLKQLDDVPPSDAIAAAHKMFLGLICCAVDGGNTERDIKVALEIHETFNDAGITFIKDYLKK